MVQLTRVEGTRHGKMLASQMMDVTIRVMAIRPYAVQCLVSLSSLPFSICILKCTVIYLNLFSDITY